MLPLARRRSTTESRTTDGRGWRVCLEPAAVQRRKEGAVARPHEEREASAARLALTKMADIRELRRGGWPHGVRRDGGPYGARG